MKHYLAALTIVLAFGCSEPCKDDCDCAPNSLLGKWELRYFQEDWNAPVTYEPGNGLVVEFTSTDYREYNDGVLQVESKYTLSPANPGNIPDPTQNLNLADLGETRRVVIQDAALIITKGHPEVDNGSTSRYAQIADCCGMIQL